MYKYILGLIVMVTLVGCQEVRIEEHKEWAKFFEEEQVKGAIEYIDNNKERVHYYDKDFNSTRFNPGGAFQIFAALVAIESAVAPTEEHKIAWDGKYYDVQNGVVSVSDTPNNKGLLHNWSQDLTLTQAFKYNAAPYFKQLVSTIAFDEMQHFVDTVKYGNRKIDSVGTNYWNDGTLKITPDEQLGFIKRLYHSELRGFTERSQRITRSLFDKVEKENYSLYSKSFTTQQGDTTMVQYVGFLEKIKNLKNPKTQEIDPIPHPYFFIISVYDNTKNSANIEAKAQRIFERILKETDLKETFDNF